MIRRLSRWRKQLRQRTGAMLFDHGLHGLARLGRLHPHARPGRHGVYRHYAC